MAVVFTDGFDHYSGSSGGAGTFLQKWTSYSANAGINDHFLIQGLARTGGQAMRLRSRGDNVGQDSCAIWKTLSASTSTMIVAFGFYATESNVSTGNGTLHIIRTSGGTSVAGFDYNPGSQLLTAYVAGGSISTAVTCALQTWHHLELKITSGTCAARLNGTEFFNVTESVTAGAQQVYFHSGAVPSSGSASSRYHYIDDLVVMDGTDDGTGANNFIGDAEVHTLSPTAAGTYTEWTPSAGSNWDAVNEQPASDADYVTAQASGTRDLYTMADLPGSVALVYAVQEIARTRKVDSGPNPTQNFLRTGGTDFASASHDMTTSFVNRFNLRGTNPNTTSAWTASEINALEAGVKIA